MVGAKLFPYNIQWNLGHLDELQKAEIDKKSKLVPLVSIKTHNWIKTQVINLIIEVVVTNKFHSISFGREMPAWLGDIYTKLLFFLSSNIPSD